MINASIIENPKGASNCLETLISKTCPDIRISYKADSMAKVRDQLKDLRQELVFMDLDDVSEGEIDLVDQFVSKDLEVIFVTSKPEHALKAMKSGASGYIVKPVTRNDLLRTVNNVLKKIRRKEEHARDKKIIEKLSRQEKHDHIIGIPTLEGFEFIRIEEIIRCEGLQKCTRIVTTEKTDLISSYNLGEFRKLLEPCGFFSPHKSHLINLKYIRKYHREGSIIMVNGSDVPVAKRRKKDFLAQFTHF